MKHRIVPATLEIIHAARDKNYSLLSHEESVIVELADHIDRLEAVRKKADAALKAYEAWEANMLENAPVAWFDNMPDDLYEGMLKCQRLRNEALKESDGVV